MAYVHKENVVPGVFGLWRDIVRAAGARHPDVAVEDYSLDPVSKAYANFFDSEDFRTCKRCGEVGPDPRA